jgi:parallel beta-helix repeat protein
MIPARMRRLGPLVAGGVVLLTFLTWGSTATAATSKANKSAPSSGASSELNPESTEQLNLCGISQGIATYHGTSAKRDLRRATVDPLKVVEFPCDFPAQIRGIRLDPHAVSLIAGGQFVRSIPLAASGPVTLPQLTALINDPSWIAQTSPGVFELKASLVQEAGTILDVEAPGVRTLRIDNTEAATVGGSSATANFTGVTVESWNPKKRAPVTSPTFGRPFILYENASQLNILHSTMEYLGSDETSGYGVSWRVDGSNGVVDDSLFQHNFFGVYTFQAAHVTFENSTFRHNVFYGIDPHTGSTLLTITNNNVYGNDDHGIVFSRYVTNSIVSRNYVHGNRVNGIMMDFHSDGNIIADNIVTGNAQGIVMSGSARDNVYGNTITNNDVGIRASHDGADLDDIHNNKITGGRIGIQLYAGATTTRVVHNVIRGPSSTGMFLDSPRSVVNSNRISDTPTGMKVLTVTTVVGGTLAAEKTGIEVGPEGFASIRSAAVDATKPVSHAAGSIVQLTGTSFQLPSTGSSLSGLDIAGVCILVFALLCEILHLARGRSVKRFALSLDGQQPGGALVERPVNRLSRFSVQLHISEHPTAKKRWRTFVAGVAFICICLILGLLIGLARARPPGLDRPFTTPEVEAAISKAYGGTGSGAELTAALQAATQLRTMPTDVTPSLAALPTDFGMIDYGCQVGRAATAPLLPCNEFGDPNGKVQAVLVGDSHAGMWLPAVNEIALKNGWQLTFVAKTGCPLGDYPDFALAGYTNGPYTQCNAWRSAVLARISTIKPAVVIVASEERSIAAKEPSGLTESLEAIKKSAKTIVFLADTPNPVIDVPECLAQHETNIRACNLPLANSSVGSSGRLAEIAGAKAAGAAIVDPTPWFCIGTVCPVIIQHTIVYFDTSHITAAYALLREPQLAAAINSAVKRT